MSHNIQPFRILVCIRQVVEFWNKDRIDRIRIKTQSSWRTFTMAKLGLDLVLAHSGTLESMLKTP